jgi:hypothetical protein
MSGSVDVGIELGYMNKVGSDAGWPSYLLLECGEEQGQEDLYAGGALKMILYTVKNQANKIT